MSRHYSIHWPLTGLIQRQLTPAEVGGSELKVEVRLEQDASQGHCSHSALLGLD